MRRILAIASIALRTAVRSRVVVILLGLLLLAIVGLPATVKSDGTLAGRVQILLTYTLAAVSTILSVATVWAGCAAVATEVQEKQLHLILTKPVRRVEVWLGKWLGLLALNGGLLVVCGVAIYAGLWWHTRPGTLTAEEQRRLGEEILVARREVLPEPLDVTAPAQQILAEQQKRGAVPAGRPVEQVLAAIQDSLRQAAFTVPTGYKRMWTFKLPALPTGEQPVVLRYKLASSQIAGALVDGLWLVGPADSAERVEIRVTNAAQGVHSVSIPVAALRGSREVVVEYANINPVPLAVLFDPQDGLALLVFEGTFVGNFVRGILVVFLQLAFLAALAVSAGTLMSLPVAALVTGYVVLLIQVGEHVQRLSQERGTFMGGTQGTGGTMLDQVLRFVLWLESAVVQPLQGPSVLEYLAGGKLISWGWVGWELVIKVALYAGVLAALTTFFFNRREIALPTQ